MLDDYRKVIAGVRVLLRYQILLLNFSHLDPLCRFRRGRSKRRLRLPAAATVGLPLAFRRPRSDSH